jgi:hypothetical protein
MTGALCGALAILLGSVVLAGWAVHSTFLIQVAPNLAPMQRNTAASFILSGLALVGMVMSKPRLTLVCSAITAPLAAATLLEFLFHVNFGIDELLGATYIASNAYGPSRMAPTTALCFIFLAASFVLAQANLVANRSQMLGLVASLVAAVGATCCISVLWGSGDAFAWAGLARSFSHRTWILATRDRRRGRGLGYDSTRTQRARLGADRRGHFSRNVPRGIVAGIFS